MKKTVRILTILALVIILALAIVSCDMSDRDDKEETTTEEITTTEETTVEATETETEERECEHSWTEIGRVEPTCTQNGSINYRCTLCEDKRTESINKAEHTVITVPGVAPTCEKSGYSDSTKCSVCDTVLTSAKYLAPTGPHNEVTVYGYSATCTTDGLTDGVKCSTCGEFIWEQEVIKASHQWTILEGKDPTCTEPGYTGNKICDVCGDSYTEFEEIPPAHTNLQVIEGYAATCQSTGLTNGEKCLDCGTVTVEQEIIPQGTHTYETVLGYAATCLSNGLSDGEQCSYCGDVITPQIIIYSEGHVFENGECTGCHVTVTEGLVFVPVANTSVYSMRARSSVEYYVAGFENGYGDDVTLLVIPDTYEGGAVVGIAEGAFQGCESIEKVILPSSITDVEANAFEGCTALEIVECHDLAQMELWSNDWSGGSAIKVSAAFNDGKNPYDIYLDAMRNVGHNFDRYVVTSETYTHACIYGQIVNTMSYTYTKQMQSGRDCYVYQYAVSYDDYGNSSEEATLWYVDGCIYIANYDGMGTNLMMNASYEAWLSMTTSSNAVELTPEFFLSVEYYYLDGKMHLSVSIDPSVMAGAMGSIGSEALISQLVYEYEFDENGAIAAYSMTTGFYAGMGTDADGNSVPIEIVMTSESTFSQVGTLDAVESIPTYLVWTDMSKIGCEDRGIEHSPVVIPGVDPTCFGLGRTECSYCSNCLKTIVAVEILDPAHTFVGDICVDCGAHNHD